MATGLRRGELFGLWKMILLALNEALDRRMIDILLALDKLKLISYLERLLPVLQVRRAKAFGERQQ